LLEADGSAERRGALSRAHRQSGVDPLSMDTSLAVARFDSRERMLSQRARYALKAMINLARSEGGSRQVSAIAADENIPRKFLEGIMSELRRAGLVESARGKTGGYRLARPADLISFGDVIRLTDGPLALAPCVSRNFYKRCDDCADEATCTLRRVLAQVRNLASEILDQTTLASAVAGGPAAALVRDSISEAVGSA
jgi:Rrf2 family protein